MSELITAERDYGAKLEIGCDVDNEYQSLLIKQDTDSHLSNQQTVINLCNNKVRLTIWCMIYLIYAGIRAANGAAEHIYWSHAPETDPDSSWNVLTPHADAHVEYYSYLISSYILLWCAAAIWLCNLYCSFSRIESIDYLCALLFVVGVIINVVAAVKGVDTYCGDMNVLDGEGWCRVQFVMNNIFLWLFSMYMAVDVVLFIGDCIKKRIFISALFILIYSILHFSFWRWILDSEFNSGLAEFAVRSAVGGNLLNAIVCAVIMIFIVICDSEIFSRKNIMIIPVAKIMGVLLVVGTSFGFMSTWLAGGGVSVTFYEEIGGGTLSLAIVAIILLVYDIQYKFQCNKMKSIKY
eukprot:279464_1